MVSHLGNSLSHGAAPRIGLSLISTRTRGGGHAAFLGQGWATAACGFAEKEKDAEMGGSPRGGGFGCAAHFGAEGYDGIVRADIFRLLSGDWY